MKLTGSQVQQIRDALLDAFPTLDSLRMLVRIELEEHLEAIAGSGDLRVVVFNLVSWAERNGRVDVLLAGARKQMPDNPALKQLMADWPALAPAGVKPVLTSPLEGVSRSAGPSFIELFLSYSRKDSDAMHQVLDALREAGLSAWTDEGLDPGTQSWQDAISDALSQAKGMVVLLSPNVNSSTWVKREVAYAQARGKRVFPILISGDDATSVPLSLIDAHWVDGRGNLDKAVSQFLLPGLRRFLAPAEGSTTKSATTGESYAVPSSDAAIKRSPFIPPPLQPWIVPLILLLCVLMGFLLWQKLQPQVSIAERSVCDAPGALGETAGSSFALCVREGGLGSTTILGPDLKGLTPVAAPQRSDGGAWLQSNTLYEVLAAPGTKLTVQRALLGFQATPAVTSVPLGPNSIVDVGLIPGASVLCGIDEKIALTVDLERQLSGGDQLAVISDAQQEPFSPAGGETHYEKRLEDNLLKDALVACEKEDNFAEVSAALQVKLTGQSFAPVVSAPVTVTLRPALCKLVPGATLSTGPTTVYAAEAAADPQMDVRIIANSANGTWVPVRTQSSTVSSWVQEDSLDCSADPAVTAALAAKRFPVPTLPGEPTPTPIPLTPTPTPAP